MAQEQDDVQALKERVRELEKKIIEIEMEVELKNNGGYCPPSMMEAKLRLSKDDVARHSRQLLMPEIAVNGQLGIVNSSVLIVGAGGLGSPAALYLAAAGIRRIGIVDYDNVELNNLHRQIIHTEYRIGMSKALSAKRSLEQLNSQVDCIPFHCSLSPENITPIVQGFDIVLDCTDNAATRYLLNDACVLLKKPLVSASALRMEGQLTVYNYDDGPCYRCLFPKPPPAASVTNCGDGGVLGCVPGVMGCLQALEAIKVAILLHHARLGTNPPSHMSVLTKKLLLFNGLEGSFRTVRIRSRRSDCAVCGENPSITSVMNDYEAFCGSPACDKTSSKNILERDRRITCQKYEEMRRNGVPHVLLDVRPQVQFDICSLPNALPVPLEEMEDKANVIREAKEKVQIQTGANDVAGNKSQDAVIKLDEMGLTGSQDIIGGLASWARDIDEEFPMY